MRTEILNYLKAENGKLKKGEVDTFNIAPFIAKTFPNAAPKEVKQLLNSMNEENVINASGDYGSLGASFGGLVKGVKDVVIHAQLTTKGKTELAATEKKEPVKQELPSVHTPVKPDEIIPSATEKKEPTEGDKALQTIINHVNAPIAASADPAK